MADLRRHLWPFSRKNTDQTQIRKNTDAISKEDVQSCLEEAAAILKTWSFERLKKLRERYEPDGQTPDIIMNVKGSTAHISVVLGELGYLRKRICVELMFWIKDDWYAQSFPGKYFERFESGRTYPRNLLESKNQ